MKSIKMKANEVNENEQELVRERIIVLFNHMVLNLRSICVSKILC